jgi:hypothetical protein
MSVDERNRFREFLLLCAIFAIFAAGIFGSFLWWVLSG